MKYPFTLGKFFLVEKTNNFTKEIETHEEEK